MPIPWNPWVKRNIIQALEKGWNRLCAGTAYTLNQIPFLMFSPAAGKKHPNPKPNPDPSWLPTRLAHYNTLQPDLFLPRPFTKALRRFAVIGDSGSGFRGQWQIAEQMLRAYEREPFGSVLMLGDNVYEFGEPERFDAAIYEPYRELFHQGVRFYPVLGNHDVRKGFGEKQLIYWGAPKYYNFSLGPVEFFAIDTTVFIPGFDGTYFNNLALAEKEAEIQYQWLDKVLGESRAETKVVFGHYPMYSSGIHSALESQYVAFRHRLEPLLVKHGVTMYLSGHEHLFERSAPIQGVYHLVSGAAGKVFRFYMPVAFHRRERAIASYHFVLFDILENGDLSFHVIGRRGQCMDHGMIRSNKRMKRVPSPADAG